MGKCESASLAGDAERLYVLPSAHGGGGVTDVAYASVARELGEGIVREDVFDKAGALADTQSAVRTADGDSAGLLAAVLDGLQRHESVAGGAIHPVDSNYAALFVQLIKAIFKQDHSLLWFQSYTKHKISIFSVWIYRQLSKNRN